MEMTSIELKERIARSGMSRREFAEWLGVSLDYVNAWCKSGTAARSVPEEYAERIRGMVQTVLSDGTDGTNPAEVVPLEPVVPLASGTDGTEPRDEFAGLKKLAHHLAGDFETGYQPITEEYAKSLGYFTAYKGADWFERARWAILASRRLGEMRGKILDHPRWQEETK